VKVILISPPMHPKIERDIMRMVPPLGVYTLAGVLIRNGYDVEVYDHQSLVELYDDSWDAECIKELVSDAQVVGISTNSFNWAMGKELIDTIKSFPEAPYIVCGGIHPTFYDIHALEVSKADAVILGEGEDTILKLVDALEKGQSMEGISNITYRQGGGIVKNNFINPKTFSDYGTPAYELIPEKTYYNIPVETSRGCSFHCEFCSILDAHNWRGLDVESSIGRMSEAAKFVTRNSMFNSIFIIDNCFTTDIGRATNILKNICAQKSNYTIHFESRCTDILKSKEFLESMVPNRISTIQIGIECGYDEGLLKIKKGLRIKDIEECLRMLESKDLAKKALLSFMIGFPWEKEEDCIKTIEFAKYLENKYRSVIGVNWWMPLKSPILDKSERFGFNFNENIYDDPLWTKNMDFINSAYANLSLGDIKDISRRYCNIVTNLTEMV